MQVQEVPWDRYTVFQDFGNVLVRCEDHKVWGQFPVAKGLAFSSEKNGVDFRHLSDWVADHEERYHS
jgi:hypothetical protein